uniref:Uncharacterized protein n=1 Tax=Arion vulgaris TaxID=1028688 RepID=A0A0B7B7R0_9EUPU
MLDILRHDELEKTNMNENILAKKRSGRPRIGWIQDRTDDLSRVAAEVEHLACL